MKEKKSTLQEGAMRYGTAMGIFWSIKFILFPLGMKMPLLLMLFFFLTIAVPIVGYYFVKRYRNDECEGYISFSRAFMFTSFMYLFAALFVTIVHYIYFQYFDNGLIVNTYNEMLNQLAISTSGELEASIQEFQTALDMIAQLTPIEISLQLISQNIFYCIIIAIPTAMLVMRNKKGI